MAKKSKFEHLYMRSHICGRCGRGLTSATSIKRGYGRDCWEVLTNQGDYGKAKSLISQRMEG